MCVCVCVCLRVRCVCVRERVCARVCKPMPVHLRFCRARLQVCVCLLPHGMPLPAPASPFLVKQTNSVIPHTYELHKHAERQTLHSVPCSRERANTLLKDVLEQLRKDDMIVLQVGFKKEVRELEEVCREGAAAGCAKADARCPIGT